MNSVRVVVPLAIRQFVVEVFVKTAVAKPALPSRFGNTDKVFLNLTVAF